MATEKNGRIAQELMQFGWRLSPEYIENVLAEKNFSSSKECMEELYSLDLRRDHYLDRAMYEGGGSPMKRGTWVFLCGVE